MLYIPVLRSFLILTTILSLSVSVVAQDTEGGGMTSGNSSNAMREFIMSATYGVLAGTLVGAASLAFTDQPGQNLQRVARGASLGLYLGVALGAYVVYGVSDGEDFNENDIYQQPGYPGPDGEGLPPAPQGQLRFQVFPLISQRGIEGAAANLRLATF